VFLLKILEINYGLRSLRTLLERGFTVDMFNNAARLYMYSILREAAGEKERPCAKDPDILRQMAYLHSLFPHAKFIYMVRDPRAQLVSGLRHLRRELSEANKRAAMQAWDDFNRKVFSQCQRIGPSACQIVHYERLVLDFNRTMTEVVQFLDVAWTDDFLRHEAFVGGRVKVSEVEWSTRQIKRPVYADSLWAWSNATRFDARELRAFAGMHVTFGYDLTRANYDYLIDFRFNRTLTNS
jgi:protein-tyrosine sulfotransferase